VIRKAFSKIRRENQVSRNSQPDKGLGKELARQKKHTCRGLRELLSDHDCCTRMF
jgi:hypothetical protein